MFFFQAEDGIRDLVRSRGLGDVYKRQVVSNAGAAFQAPIATCPEDQLRASLELNLLAHQWLSLIHI